MPEKHPQAPRTVHRLIVKARPQLPKRFLWEVVHDDGSGRIVTLRESTSVYETMEAAFERGQAALAEIRARHLRMTEPKG
jgi:hypothetical protein